MSPSIFEVGAMKVLDEPAQHPAELIAIGEQRLHGCRGDVSFAACASQVANRFRQGAFRDDEISCKRFIGSLLEPFFDVGGYRISGGGNLAAKIEFSAQPG